MKKGSLGLLFVLLICVFSICAMAADTVYVNRTEQTENGYATLEEALAALPDAGGTVVICGDVSASADSELNFPAKDVTVTAENGAALTFTRSVNLGGDTVFENIKLVNGTGGRLNISCMGHALTVENTVETEVGSSIFLYVGTKAESGDGLSGGSITLKGGTWSDVHAGSYTPEHSGEVTLTVDGATVTGSLVLGNNSDGGKFTGTCNAIVKSGSIARLRTKYATGTLSAVLHGGTVASLEMPATVTPAIGGSVTIAAVTSTGSVIVKATEGYEVVLDGTVYTQVESTGTADTVYVDGVGTAENTYATLVEAMDALPLSGGTVIVKVDATLGTSSAALTLPAKSGKVKITGENGAKLKIAYGLVLGSETEFDNIELVNISGGQGYISADGNKLTIGENVTTSIENTADRWLTILGGNKTKTATSYNTDVTVKAGKWRYIFGGNSTAAFSGNARVEVSNVITNKLTAANETGTFSGTATLVVNLCGNKTVTSANYYEAPTFLVDSGYKAVLNGDTYFQMPESFTPLDTVYVRDGGIGDGSAADKPAGSLAFAYLLLGEDGGKIVLVGDTTVSGNFAFAECTGDVTLTAENGAKLLLNGSIALAKNTNGAAFTFDTPIAATNGVIYGGYRNVTFTENCTVSGTLDFYGGTLSSSVDKSDVASITDLPYTVTVKGGIFRNFGGGCFRAVANHTIGSVTAPLTVLVSGGTFTDSFSLSGDSILADDATLTVSGGTFDCPIYVRGMSTYNAATGVVNSRTVETDRKYYAMDGDITVNISGGMFNGGLVSAYDVSKVSYTQLLRGKFTVTVTGGTFAEETEFDATQVKAYAGETDDLASITYPDTYNFTVTRFDTVNGEEKEYDEPLRIAFIGDSITEGTGSTFMSLTSSYPAVFARLAAADNRDVVVANFGISGSAVSSHLRYFMGKVAWPIAIDESDSDYYLLALGTNDNSAGGRTAYRLAFEKAYTDVVEALGNLPHAKKVFITNAIARGTHNGDTQSIRVSTVIRPLQERIAKAFVAKDANKFVFVDLYGLTLDAAAAGTLLSSDTLHPDAEGYAIMAQTVYDAIFNGVTTADYRKSDVYVSASGTPYASGTKDNPISYFAHAMELLPYGGEGTIHIIGTVSCSAEAATTMLPKKLTVVGEGEDAVLEFTGGTHFKTLSDVKFDNITLKTTVADYLLSGEYNSIEMTDSVKLDGDWSFAAGFRVDEYDTEAAASSANDCTVTLGGNAAFENFMLGNYRAASKSPIGTYSGKLTVNVGKGCTASGSLVGAVGQNYLTGSVTVASPINMAEYVSVGTLASSVVYDEAKNTGTVTMTYTGETIADTVYVDGTGATEGAHATLSTAVAALPDAGGTVIVSGDTTVVGSASTAAVVLPAKSGKVTITAENGAKLQIAYGLVLGSETEFDNIEIVNLSTSQGYIAADGNKLTIGEGVTTGVDGTERWLTILGGNKTSVATSYDTDVTVKAGKWRYIFGGNSTASFSGNSTLTVSNVVTMKVTAKNEGGTFSGTSKLIFDLRSGKTVDSENYFELPTTLVDKGYRAERIGTVYSQRKMISVYISASTGADTNDGLTADTPKATLGGAYGIVKNGDMLILAGDLYTSGEYVWNFNASMTVTAEKDGFWSMADGAKLTVWSNLTLDDMLFTHSGDTTVRVDRAVFAVTDTVDLAAAGGKHTLIVEENAVAILSEAAQEFFTIEGEGEVITYNPAEGVVTPTAYSNGTLQGIYVAKDYIQYIAKDIVPSMRYEEGEDFAAWKQDVIAKLGEVLGLPLTMCDDDLFRILAKTEYTDYTRVDFEFQSEPNYFVPATMLIPAGAVGELPCVITLQSHTTGMHISLGETKFDGDVTAGNDYALQAVNNGMIAVAIDQRYMGGAGQDSAGKATCRGGTTVNTVLYGRTVIGERVWDVQRLIDVLYTHFGDFVDEENLICLGNEAGGMTTFFASALDERIKISVPASAISTYETSIIAKRPCCCYDIPGFEQYFDMGDVGMLIAPRKLLVVSGKTDPTFPIAGAEESFALMQSAYTMLGAADNCTHLIGNGGSSLYADEAWPIICDYVTETTSDSTATAADITVSTAVTGITKIYDSTKYIQHIGRNVEPLLRYHDGEDFAEWQKNAKAKLVELLGMPTEKCTDDHFRILKETECDGYTRMDFEFQSEENYFVRGSILIPAGARGKLPCAITLQGHTSGMHISVGDPKSDDDIPHIVGDSDFAVRAAREGVIGVAIEQRYMGTSGVGGSCLAHVTMNTQLYGRTAIGERIWDVSRTIDVLEKYFSDSIDFDKLILMGNSGGGTATFYTSCVEDRIRISVPSCAFSTYMDSIVTQWHCRCNYIPGVAKYFDMGDASMLIAPKKLLFVIGRNDPIFPIAGAKAQFAITQKAYALLGIGADCMLLDGGDGHRFYPDAAWPIIHTYLGTEREAVDTVYVDGTGATPGAYAQLAEAASRLPDSGGTIIVSGDTDLGTATTGVYMPPKSGKITVVGQNGAKLNILHVLWLGGETEFDNIELCNASANYGYIYAQGNKLTIGKNVKTTKAEGVNNYLMLFGGHHDKSNAATTHLVIQSGTYRDIHGANYGGTAFTGATRVEVSNVTVTGELSHKNFYDFAGSGVLVLDLRGGKTVTAAKFVEPTFLVDAGHTAIQDGDTYRQVDNSLISDTVYVDGTGKTEGAYTTLMAAISMLPSTGGTVIVSGDTAMPVGTNFILPEKDGKVKIVGENGAKLSLGWGLNLSCEVEFDNIELVNANAYMGFILARGHKLTIGENVTTSTSNANNRKIAIYGGDCISTNVTDYDSHLVIKSGDWWQIFGGHNKGTFNGNSIVEVSNITVSYGLSAKTEEGAFNGTSAELILDLRSDKTVTAKTYKMNPTSIRTDEGYSAVLDGNTYKQIKVAVAGDVNGDGKLTVADVLLILRAVLNDSAPENADANGDGAVTFLDAVRVLKQAVQ